MNKTLKIISVISLVSIALLFSLLHFTNKKSRSIDTTNVNSKIQISSEQLINAFEGNERQADSMFVEKTIEVEGKLKEITFLNNRYTLLLQGVMDNSFVICDLQPNQYHKINNLILDRSITVKGVCKGYLMDAILLNCVILKPFMNE